MARTVGTIGEMLEAVRAFHRKNRLRETGGEEMHYRMNLMMEELGEICEAITKGKPKAVLEEEHADLLILLLGNVVSADLAIEEAFWTKMDRIMKRKAIRVGDRLRVTETP